uniref:Uncharacterized protein n=1 Tax=Hyaloperonospora arabidopsidis (strain Emoy2) TaxID=559515 RepID=M4B7V3_HYAAE
MSLGIQGRIGATASTQVDEDTDMRWQKEIGSMQGHIDHHHCGDDQGSSKEIADADQCWSMRWKTRSDSCVSEIHPDSRASSSHQEDEAIHPELTEVEVLEEIRNCREGRERQ